VGGLPCGGGAIFVFDFDDWGAFIGVSSIRWDDLSTLNTWW
jgi:hypothetical protein